MWAPSQLRCPFNVHLGNKMALPNQQRYKIHWSGLVRFASSLWRLEDKSIGIALIVVGLLSVTLGRIFIVVDNFLLARCNFMKLGTGRPQRCKVSVTSPLLKNVGHVIRWTSALSSQLSVFVICIAWAELSHYLYHNHHTYPNGYHMFQCGSNTIYEGFLLAEKEKSTAIFKEVISKEECRWLITLLVLLLVLCSCTCACTCIYTRTCTLYLSGYRAI